ncbi:hypothetical protein [Lysinibacillus fusiformis]|uniref:hypothetical protein n=1 Tax=Lysinibacillus fusiformis TaxID=28031 RepID=UPI003D07948D
MQTYAQLQSFSKYNTIIGVIIEDFFTNERLYSHYTVTSVGQLLIHPYKETLPYKLRDGLFKEEGT